MIKISTYAQPGQFIALATRFIPWVAGFTVCLFSIGLYLALISSPPDYQQGETVRIMYVHVPCAWMAIGIYCFVACLSAVFLFLKYPLAGIIARSAAPVGAGFTFLSLLTGSLWGKPMWGAWWVWDARLTSVLVLFFLYLGYLALLDAFEDQEWSLNAASLLAVVGIINIPIIKGSVIWWNTLHQPASVIRMAAPAVHISMLVPLLLMTLAFISYFIWMLLLKIKISLIGLRISALQIKLVDRALKEVE